MKKAYIIIAVLVAGFALAELAGNTIVSTAASSGASAVAAGSDTVIGPDGKPVDAVGYNPSAAAQLAQATRRLLGERTLKEYHQKVHQNGVSCQLCHSGEAPTTPPDETNCIRCHGTASQMAEKTAKLERNPHKSPHYGVYVPCTTCHKEHQPSKVLCYDCHSFRFENFKQ